MAIVDEAGIKITPDTSGFAAELRAELEREIAAATAGLDDTIHINIDVDSDAARAKLAQSLDEFGEDGTRAFDKLNNEQNDLFDGINKNTEKTRDKIVLETTKTRDRVNQRLEPFWRRLKLKLTGTKKDFDQIKRSALDASRAMTGVTGGVTGNGSIDRAERDRAAAYAASEAAARKLAKAEQDLNKARAERQASSTKLSAAEEKLAAAEERHERTGAALTEAERKLAREQALRYPHAVRLAKAEEDVSKAREAHAKSTAAYYEAEAKVSEAQQRTVDSTNRVIDAENRHSESHDRLAETSDRVIEAERNVTRAHEDHDAALRRSESAVGRFTTFLERQGGQMERIGGLLDRVGGKTSVFGRLTSIAGGAVRGFGQVIQGLGGLMRGASGATDLLKDGIGTLASTAGSAIGFIVEFGAKLALVGVIAGAVSFAVGAVGSALIAIPPLALSAGAAIATVALGMDGIKRAYDSSLKPAIEELQRQVSEVFEQKFKIAFENISKNLIPQVTQGFKDIAAAIGDSAIKFSEFITQGKQVENIKTILRETADNIRDQLYPAVQNVIEKFLEFSAVPGVLDAVYGIISDLIQNTANWVDEMIRSGEGKASIEALRGVLDTVEKTFFQVLTSAMKFFRESADGFRGLIESAGNLASSLLDDLGPAFDDVLDAAKQFIDTIPPSTVDTLKESIKNLSEAFKDLSDSGISGALLDGISGLIDEFTGLIDIVNGVADAYNFLNYHFSKFQESIGIVTETTRENITTYEQAEEAAKKYGEAASTSAENAVPPVERLGDASANAAEKTQQAGQKMGDAFNPVAPAADAAGKGAADGINKPVGDIPGKVDDSVAQIDFSPVLEKAREVFGALPKSVADGLNGAEQEMKTGVDKLKSVAETGAKAAVDAFKTGLGTLGQVATEAVTQARTAFATAMVQMQTAATQGAVAVVNAFKTSFDKLPQDVEAAMDRAAIAVQQGVQSIQVAFQEIDISKPTQSFEQFAQAAEQSMQRAQQAVETAMQAITTAIQNGTQTSQQAVETAFQQIEQKITDSMEKSRQATEEAMRAIAQVIQSEGQKAVQNAQQVGEQIVQVFTDLADKMEQAGRTMMERLAAGITAGGASAVAAAQGVAARIKAQFPSSPAKEGPLSGSGDTQVSGGKIMTRLGEGMESKAEEALSKVRKVAEEARRIIDSINRSAGGNGDPIGTRYEDGSVKGGRRAGDSPDDFDRFGRIRSGGAAQSYNGGGGVNPRELYAAVAAGVAAGMPDKLRIEDDGRNGVARLANRGNRNMSRQ